MNADKLHDRIRAASPAQLDVWCLWLQGYRWVEGITGVQVILSPWDVERQGGKISGEGRKEYLPDPTADPEAELYLVDQHRPTLGNAAAFQLLAWALRRDMGAHGAFWFMCRSLEGPWMTAAHSAADGTGADVIWHHVPVDDGETAGSTGSEDARSLRMAFCRVVCSWAVRAGLLFATEVSA